ncbi:hypothetical protein EYF80_052790 [Liparis tanakae]|uniref:Uncharacterized protein n=1 Tax=Liparis tanakae TaxID=230148 RepID=A0A4Z2F7C6_9TELE|nr:hypothetical protein EYF80_052790 [Liparis tanakae]
MTAAAATEIGSGCTDAETRNRERLRDEEIDAHGERVAVTRGAVERRAGRPPGAGPDADLAAHFWSHFLLRLHKDSTLP